MSVGGNGLRLGQKLRAGWVGDLKRYFSDVDALVVAQVDRVPTGALNGLRQILEESQASLYLVKNSLCRRAFQDLGLQDLEKWLQGSCSVTAIRSDAASVCKLLARFSKEYKGFVLRGGLLEGRLLSSQELLVLARLPSRDLLLSQVIGGIRSPLTGLVGSLKAIQRGLVSVIHAIVNKQEGGGSK